MILGYQKKLIQHVQRMDTNRLPKQALQYKPKVATTCTEDGHKQTTIYIVKNWFHIYSCAHTYTGTITLASITLLIAYGTIA